VPQEAPVRSSLAVRIIAAILVIAALALGRDLFVPIALALCFQALLRPLVRGLERARLPAPAGAAIVVLGGLALAVVGGWALSGPVGAWVDKAPASIATAREKLRALGKPLTQLSDAASGAAAAPIAPPAPAPADTTKAPAPPPPPARPSQQPGSQPIPSIFTQLLGRGTTFVGAFVEVLVLLYLMLASGSLLFRKALKLVPTSGDKRTANDIVDETESIVSRYLVITALINIGQGVAVGVAMWAIGMPNPLIWGLLTFVFEFIPFLGGIINVALLLIGGMTAFTSTGQILLPAIIYMVITTLQNNVVSPYAYGNRLKLNPLAVIICVLFWWFIWGIPGAFLAIPIAATLKVLGDQVPRLKPMGELLGD
jgi:predicted PurR-regulated permease PerM